MFCVGASLSVIARAIFILSSFVLWIPSMETPLRIHTCECFQDSFYRRIFADLVIATHSCLQRWRWHYVNWRLWYFERRAKESIAQSSANWFPCVKADETLCATKLRVLLESGPECRLNSNHPIVNYCIKISENTCLATCILACFFVNACWNNHTCVTDEFAYTVVTVPN